VAAGAVVCLSAAVAACSSPGSAKPTAAAPLSPSQAVLVAAHSAAKVNTFSGTIALQGTYDESGSSGTIDMSGTMSGQLRPSLTFSANIGTFTTAGQKIGPMGEVLTTKDLYLKMGMLTQMLRTTKPWLEMPVSALSGKSGVNLSSLVGEAQNSSPLTESQMLAGATDVKKAGTGTVDGVPVTEYTGIITMAKAIDALPASTRAQLQQEMTEAGIKTATFKVWLDGQNQVKKEVVVEDGKAVSETITVTITSVNQPVTITPPPAGQVTQIPASVLSGS
jgi:hypothetical protein